MRTVAITGATGFLAAWICQEFLDAGWAVRGTVRSLNSSSTQALKAALKPGQGSLELFEADLLQPGSFAKAFEGCHAVIHTASPFVIEKVRDARKELIQPALDGTVNVLSSLPSSVKRVVLTSSVVAIHGWNDDVPLNGRAYTEDDWNLTSTPENLPYPASKTLAERKAWELAEGAPWSLVVVNPGFVLGPTLTGRADGASLGLMKRLLSGGFATGVPGFDFGIVDVRDVARAHFLAATVATASGRHILVGDHADLLDLGRRFSRLVPSLKGLPRAKLPRPLLWLIAPLIGFTREYVRHQVDKTVRYDNSRSQTHLGLTYRALDTTLADMAASLQQA
jgi:nucleoside-diphosphate-sugar epimerase